MAQAVWLRPVTSKAGVWSWVSPCGICGGQSGTVSCFFLLGRWCFSFSISTPIVHMHFHSSSTDVRQTNRRSKGNIRKFSVPPGWKGNWRGTAFTLWVFKGLRTFGRLCWLIIGKNEMYRDYSYSLFQNGCYLAVCRTQLGQEWRPDHTAGPLWSQ
jgi:hypothetical protein